MPESIWLDQHLACTACRLKDYRTQVVPGSGPLDARMCFIAEAPGQKEDEQGIPLVGAAGKLFDTLLLDCGLKRSEVFATNVVHCRPPRNDLSAFPDALDQCPKLWLTGDGGELSQLKHLRVIVVMGQTAGALWFPGKRAHQLAIMNAAWQPGFAPGRTIVVGSYHPAAALHADEPERIEESIKASMRRAKGYAEMSEVIR